MRLLSLVLVFLFSSFSSAADVDMTNPNHVIRSVSSQTLDRISAEKERLEKDPKYVQVIVEEELIPYFDYKYAAFLVMGNAVRETTKEQRDAFVDAFKTSLVNTYGHILFEYDNHQLTIIDNNNFADKTIVSVEVRITDAQGQVTKLLFKLRKNKKTKEWKVYDVIAEGISMLSTKQSELGELIRKNGIDNVIELLKEKNKELAS